MLEYNSEVLRKFAGLISRKISEKEIVVIGNGYGFSYNRILLYVRVHKLNITPKGYSVSSYLVNTEDVSKELGTGFFKGTKEYQLECVKNALNIA